MDKLEDDFFSECADSLVVESQNLSGQSALVTGASSGIGLAIALQLMQEGAQVLAVARRSERLIALQEFARREGLPGPLEILAADQTDSRFVSALADAGWSKPDILICNAGLARGLDPIAESNSEDWAEMIETNVSSTFQLVRHVLPRMIERGAGTIVGIGSTAGHTPYEGGSVYCASKHALRAFFTALRLETCGTGVRACLVSPGMVETAFSTIRFHGQTERAAGVYAGADPLRAADVADQVMHILHQPNRVNIDDMIVTPHRQVNAFKIVRRTDVTTK
jgi:3-hydroxy acid dehydrogenase/malonic semialdehyde reductase